jgi:hypothetical protein
MPTTYTRAANPQWRFLTELGEYANDGSMTTYKQSAKSEKKATYADAAGTIENPNPIRLDELGQVGPKIYWADDEKYYVEIRDRNGALITAFDNFPDAGSGGGSSTVGLDFENQLINGQFRFIYETSHDPLSAGIIDLGDNWTFEKSNNSGSDKIEFVRFNLGDNEPEATPIQYLHYVCTAAGTGETKKDIVQKMSDVRTFEQTQVSFSFDVYCVDTRTIEVFLIQNFGTGGSPSGEIPTTIGSFSVAAGTWYKKSATITVPPVGGYTRGTNDDDYIAIVIRLPLDSTADIKLTNILLTDTAAVYPYPRMTKEREDSEILGSMIPTIGANDYGKVITATRTRKYTLAFPVPVASFIEYGGQIYTDDDDWAICNGATVSVTQDSARYSRLYSAIGHAWGRPDNGWIATTNGDKVTICTTTIDTVTAPSNGTSSPGFTHTQYVASSNTRYNFNSKPPATSLANLYIENLINGITTTLVNSGALTSFRTFIHGNTHKKQITEIVTKAGSAITGGQYFIVYNTTTHYNYWYKVGGAGTAPAVGGTNVEIDINTTDTASEVTLKTLAYITGYQVDVIQTVAASAMPAGSYININTSTDQYYAWFTIGGSGTDPKPTGRIGIKVELLSGDSAAQVATKLAIKIDAEFFKKPDRRGFFTRGYDSTATIDFDPRLGSGVGSRQYDEVMKHYHTLNAYRGSDLDTTTTPGNTSLANTGAGVIPTTADNLDLNNGGNLPAGEGGYENRPLNVTVNYLIKL